MVARDSTFARYLAPAWGVIAVAVLMWPGRAGGPTDGVTDKLGHLALFGVLGALWARAASARIASAREVLWWVGVQGSLLGIATEVLQGVLDAAAGWARSAEVADAVADGLGTVLGAWLAVRRGRSPTKKSAAP